MKSIPRNKKFRTVHIKRVPNGYILTAGINQLVFNNAQKLMDWVYIHVMV